MSRPATKADLEELREELRAELASKADLERLRAELGAEIRTALVPYATKQDLEIWGSALYDLIEASQRETVNLEQRERR